MRHKASSRRLLFFSNFHRRHLPLTAYQKALFQIVTNMFMGMGEWVGAGLVMVLISHTVTHPPSPNNYIMIR